MSALFLECNVLRLNPGPCFSIKTVLLGTGISIMNIIIHRRTIIQIETYLSIYLKPTSTDMFYVICFYVCVYVLSRITILHYVSKLSTAPNEPKLICKLDSHSYIARSFLKDLRLAWLYHWRSTVIRWMFKSYSNNLLISVMILTSSSNICSDASWAWWIYRYRCQV